MQITQIVATKIRLCLLLLTGILLFCCSGIPSSNAQFVLDADEVPLTATAKNLKRIPSPPKPTSSSTKMLKGFVEHSVHLPSVAKDLRAGLLFDARKLPKYAKGNKWYRIPLWSVGSWEKEKETRYFSYDFDTEDEDRYNSTFTSIGGETRGWQRDRLGNIWHFKAAPFISTVRGDDTVTIQLVQEHEPIFVSNEKLVEHFRSTDIIVSLRSHRILDVHQSESIQTYTRLWDGYLQCVGSIKRFDEDGNPVKLVQDVSAAVRIRSFEPWMTYKGEDMYIKFVEFLKSNQLDELIPPRPRVSHQPSETVPKYESVDY